LYVPLNIKTGHFRYIVPSPSLSMLLKKLNQTRYNKCRHASVNWKML